MKTMSEAARIRSEIGHPVIDGDGHIIEHREVLKEFIGDHGRGDLVDRARFFEGPDGTGGRAWLATPMQERRKAGLVAPTYWVAPGEAEYFATVSIPGRYYERLGEAGIDFSVLYPTRGLVLSIEEEEECRVELCSLYNAYLAEEYGPYADRLTPAAVIPMQTPTEAIRALEHAAGLGLKVGLIPTYVWRELDVPSGPTRSLRYIDTFGIDSDYDYDLVWAKAIELGFPLAAHSVSMGFTDRSSPSNFLYNQIGNFAAAGEALAKSLFLSGVTHRFPGLRMAMLEGGVAVGVRLCTDLMDRFEKRGPGVIGRLNPDNVDLDLLGRLAEEYGGRLARQDPKQLVRDWGLAEEGVRDDFELSGVERVEDIPAAFCRTFYWGCEADDPLVKVAFDEQINARTGGVPAILGSDIGHWDVPEFTHPVEEAYELVEHGILDADSFKAFVFENAVRMYGGPSPRVFAGTTVENEAAAVLSGPSPR